MRHAMKRIPLIMTLGSLLMLSACADEKVEVLKSPCVGAVGSPCGPKRPVNGMLNPGIEQGVAELFKQA